MHKIKWNASGTKEVSGDNAAPAEKSRKAYDPPVLEQYGDLDALTMGGHASAADANSVGTTTKVCWVAEVLYGVDDSRTLLLRRWLNDVYCRTTIGSVIVALYRAFGVRVAVWTRRSALLRRTLSVPFDAGVAAALRHYTLAAR